MMTLILASWFWPLTAATVATTVADIELTQHCLTAQTCYEVNPLMPTTRKGAYLVGLAVAGGQTLVGYLLKRKGHKYWWLPQTAVITGHSVGIGFGLRFIW